jgi:hypothetical protein
MFFALLFSHASDSARAHHSLLVQADFDEFVRSELSKLALPCLLPEHQFLARMIGLLSLLVFGFELIFKALATRCTAIILVGEMTSQFAFSRHQTPTHRFFALNALFLTAFLRLESQRRGAAQFLLNVALCRSSEANKPGNDADSLSRTCRDHVKVWRMRIDCRSERNSEVIKARTEEANSIETVRAIESQQVEEQADEALVERREEFKALVSDYSDFDAVKLREQYENANKILRPRTNAELSANRGFLFDSFWKATSKAEFGWLLEFGSNRVSSLCIALAHNRQVDVTIEFTGDPLCTVLRDAKGSELARESIREENVDGLPCYWITVTDKRVSVGCGQFPHFECLRFELSEALSDEIDVGFKSISDRTVSLRRIAVGRRVCAVPASLEHLMQIHLNKPHEFSLDSIANLFSQVELERSALYRVSDTSFILRAPDASVVVRLLQCDASALRCRFASIHNHDETIAAHIDFKQYERPRTDASVANRVLKASLKLE